MPTNPSKSLWDVFALMVEKSPAHTVAVSGIVLILALLFFLFLVLAASPGLRNFLREVVRGVRYTDGKLAYDGSSKADEVSVQTDEKGNVKPPTDPTEVQSSPAGANSADQDQFYWLFLIQTAYREADNPLTKLSEYYDNAQKSTGPFPLRFLEAEYLLARFKCGDASALAELIEKSGGRPESFSVNGTLANYYESIGETDHALKYLELRFQHAPDNEKKLHAVRRLAIFLAENGNQHNALAFLKEQMPYFKSPDQGAILWKTLGEIHESLKQIWQKHLCFEKSLKLDPNNTSLRFSLAYSYAETSYGTGMAAYHYRILLKQRPGDTTAANNLSLIYDEIGATDKKISLLREAALRKDNSYVASNLASAYAKAGFTDEARQCLEQVPLAEQQEPIVQRAYRIIKDQRDADERALEKLDGLIDLEKNLVFGSGFRELDHTTDGPLDRFVGEWSTSDGMTLAIVQSGGTLSCQLIYENTDYQYASYVTTPRYELGLLELDATLDEKSLKERPSSGATTTLFSGFGSIGAGLAANSLLGFARNRLAEAAVLVLVPGEDDSLRGIRAMGNRSALQNKEEMLLSAQAVKFSRAEARIRAESKTSSPRI